jgi:hypothetical protein
MSRRIEVYAYDCLDHAFEKLSEVKPIDILDLPVYIARDVQYFDVILKVYDGDTLVYSLRLEAFCNRNATDSLRLFGTMAKLKEQI